MGREEWVVIYFNEYEALLWSDEKVSKLEKSSGLHHTVTALNATELYTLRWLIVCHVNFASTKNIKS